MAQTIAAVVAIIGAVVQAGSGSRDFLLPELPCACSQASVDTMAARDCVALPRHAEHHLMGHQVMRIGGVAVAIATGGSSIEHQGCHLALYSFLTLGAYMAMLRERRPMTKRRCILWHRGLGTHTHPNAGIQLRHHHERLPVCGPGLPLCGSSGGVGVFRFGVRKLRSVKRTLSAQAAMEDSDSEVGIGVTGIVASCIMLWSEYTLKMTGHGLPEGPGGLLGAIEGISYLFVIGVVAFSIFSKVTSGSGLPAGKFGLIGAAEGISYIACVVGLVVLGFQIVERGYLDFSPFPLRLEFK